MIVHLKRLKEDKLFLTINIKFNAQEMTKTYDGVRFDFKDESQNHTLLGAGYVVENRSLYLTLGQFIDCFYKIEELIEP